MSSEFSVIHACSLSCLWGLVRVNQNIRNIFRSEDPDAEDVGHKWTLSALLRHLRSLGQDTELLMQRIEDIIIKSVLATASGIVSGIKQFVKHPDTCFGTHFLSITGSFLFLKNLLFKTFQVFISF